MNKLNRSLITSYNDCSVTIPFEQYNEITKGFMKFIMKKVHEGEQVELPARMGIMIIAGRKVIPRFNNEGEITNLAPDWVSTKKLWESNPEARERKQLVYHFNEHTAGIRYKLCWNKGMSGALNKILYIFKPSRENKRKVWKQIESGKEFYVKPKYHNYEQVSRNN